MSSAATFVWPLRVKQTIRTNAESYRTNFICTNLSFSLSVLKCTPSTLVAGSNLTSRRSSTILTFSSSVWHSPNILCSSCKAPCVFSCDCGFLACLNLAKKKSLHTTDKARLYSRRKSGLWSSLKSPGIQSYAYSLYILCTLEDMHTLCTYCVH